LTVHNLHSAILSASVMGLLNSHAEVTRPPGFEVLIPVISVSRSGNAAERLVSTAQYENNP
jgi:hypothetical protein